MIELVGIFMLTLLIITALGIVQARNLFGAVMLSGIFSLQIAVIFFLLDAADVALTEAAVGAGVATVLFLSALSLTRDYERRWSRYSLLAIPVVAAIAGAIIYAADAMPLLGDPEAPVHLHVAPWYLEKTATLIDIPNVVTAILASFRGYDTLGELFVILLAGVGVMFLLGEPWRQNTAALPSVDTAHLRHHLIPQVVGRLLLPFIVLFALYVQLHGDYGPGGGFQAGALVAAAIILYALLEGERAALALVTGRLLISLIVGGALLYGGVGVATTLLGGQFLDYSMLSAEPAAGQHLGILLVELGVGMTVTGTLVSIFLAFAMRRSHAG